MNTSVSESALIADQLHRAFEGEAWHGPALLELLEDVDAATAAATPWPGVHSIWELVLHIAAWDGAALRRLKGETVPQPSDAAWREAIAQVKLTHDSLVKTVAALPESHLRDRCPGKDYDFYFLLHGVVQHELYHAGQIAILKKAEKEAP
jgi:uncharacterized damage-inducible protein DinB